MTRRRAPEDERRGGVQVMDPIARRLWWITNPSGTLEDDASAGRRGRICQSMVAPVVSSLMKGEHRASRLAGRQSSIAQLEEGTMTSDATVLILDAGRRMLPTSLESATAVSSTA